MKLKPQSTSNTVYVLIDTVAVGLGYRFLHQLNGYLSNTINNSLMWSNIIFGEIDDGIIS